MSKGIDQKRVHIYFSGRVQGVGFRFTTRGLAHKYTIKGWVKNLFDERVELMAQGAPDALGRFLESLRSEFNGYILDEEQEWLTPDENLSEFSITL